MAKAKIALIAMLSAGLLLTGCAGAPTPKNSESATTAAGFKPFTIENCGVKVTFDKPATKAVTLNQGMTEIALALGVEKQLAGTAYLDSAIPEKWKKAYDSVKVLSEKYPAKETFLAAQPDVALASYSSAFDPEYKSFVASRDELEKQNIKSYLSIFACKDKSLRAEATFENVWKEFKDIASIFGVPEVADKTINAQKDELAKLKSENAGKDKKIVWIDGIEDAPSIGAGHGGPQLVMSAVGATNVFADMKGSWGGTTWEEIIKANPDVLVLIDADWDTAQSKMEKLAADPALANLPAVKDKKFVVIPFANSTAGINLVEGAKQLAEGLKKLN